MLMEAGRRIKRGCVSIMKEHLKIEEIDDYPPKPKPPLSYFKISKEKCIKKSEFSKIY